MSSSSERNCPSMRPRVNPCCAQRRQFLLELALAAADDGREDVDALVVRVAHTRSTMRSTDCAAISRPHCGQCGTPTFANSSRR